MALDRTSARLREQIAQASEALVRTSREAPEKWWTARDLAKAAKNGESYAAVSLALSRLIDEGVFAVDKDKVRLNG